MNQSIAEKIDVFFRQFKHQKYKKGEILIRSDEDPSGIFYLKHGAVKEYSISRKGDEVVVNMYRPISFFPMSWAVNQSANKYFFEATMDSDVWQAPREKVVEFVTANPDVLYDLLRRVYLGIDGLLIRMEHLMVGSAYTRLIVELIILAKRFGEKQGKAGAVRVKLMEKDIAEEAGISRETVSRELKNLKNKELVSFQDHSLIIKDIQKLEAELESQRESENFKWR